LQAFLTNENEQNFEVINLEHNKYLKCLTPLKSNFSSNNASKTTFSHENPERKIDESTPVNIRSDNDPKIVYISVTCKEHENEKCVALF